MCCGQASTVPPSGVKTVAERLHFGRAAEALHIAQPVLSRQIRALEDELKAQLFMRDKRSTELTAAGTQLLADARPLLASAAALRRRVTRVARGRWGDIATEVRNRTRRREPLFHSVEEKLEHVAAHHGISVLPLSVATFYSRVDVTHVAVRDIPPNRICLAWDSSRGSGLIQEFAGIAAANGAAVVGPPAT